MFKNEAAASCGSYREIVHAVLLSPAAAFGGAAVHFFVQEIGSGMVRALGSVDQKTPLL